MKKLTKVQLFLALAALLVPQVSVADPRTLTAGSKSEIEPRSSQCFVSEDVREERKDSIHKGECAEGQIGGKNFVRARMHLFTEGGLAKDGDFSVQVKHVVQFRVETFEDAPRDSFLPIHIKLPARWDGRFANSFLSPTDKFAVRGAVSANMFLRIREGDPADAKIEGPLVAQTRFMGASHAGLGKCVSLPTSKIAGATMLAKCLLGLFKRETGLRTGVELSTVIKTNQTYNLELVMEGDLLSEHPTGTGSSAEMDFMFANHKGELMGMFWDRVAIVTIGTDAEESIGEIREELARLREDFEAHTHLYLTGRGVGHNNTEALTDPPMFQGSMNGSNHADDGDGVPSFADECPFTPPGVVVDSQGCSREEFCALHSQSKGCKQADWQGDDAGKPDDCRWKKKACIAR